MTLGEAADASAGSEIQRERYEAAAWLLSDRRSPLRFWPQLQLARLDFADQNYVDANHRLGPIRDLTDDDYPLIRAYSWSIHAASQSQVARPFEAIEAYHQAIELYLQMG